MIFDDMNTARKESIRHAQKIGHTIHGETGYAWSYVGNPFTKN